MSAYDPAELFAKVERVVKSDVPVAEGVRRVVQVCEREQPHPDWAAFHSIEVEDDLSRLREWLQAILRTTPLPASITGLWFGLLNPVVGPRRRSSDLHLVGAPYSVADHDWIFGTWWGQDTPSAGSAILDAIYQRAHSGKDGLGQNAEFPLCLAYSALAIRHLAQTMGPELLRGAEERVLNVGFSSLDFLCVGALRKDGLVFSRETAFMA